MSDGTAAETPDRVDELDDLGRQLDAIADLPVEERPALFEQANQVLAGELAVLEEV